MEIKCLREIVCLHNNEFLEFVLNRNLFTYKDFAKSGNNSEPIFEDIIKYQNMKAVFLLFEREKSCIFPWCAAIS